MHTAAEKKILQCVFTVGLLQSECPRDHYNKTSKTNQRFSMSNEPHNYHVTLKAFP